MKNRMKARIWDYILCLLCQTGLIFHIFSGFVLEDRVSGNFPAAILILALLDMVYFTFLGNKIRIILGAVISLAVAAGFILWAASSRAFDDETGNSLGITLSLLLIVSLAVFLLTRTRAGIAVLFVAGTLIIAGAHFLLYETGWLPFVAFETAVFLLFLYRTFLMTKKTVHTGKVRIPIFVFQSAVLCLLALAISTGLYFGIVRPINPPTKELALITAMEERDLLWLFGMEKEPKKPEPEKPAGEEKSEENKEKPVAKPEQQTAEQTPEEEEISETPQEQQDLLHSQNNAKRTAFQKLRNYIRSHKAGSAFLLVIIVFAFAIVLRCLLKKKWVARVERLSPENRVINYYRYFLSRFLRLGYEKRPEQTLLEYTEDLPQKIRQFRSGGISFEQLTEVYIDTYYGTAPVSEEQAGWFRSFYRDFGKNVREEVGLFRYCLLYFLL